MMVLRIIVSLGIVLSSLSLSNPTRSLLLSLLLSNDITTTGIATRCENYYTNLITIIGTGGTGIVYASRLTHINRKDIDTKVSSLHGPINREKGSSTIGITKVSYPSTSISLGNECSILRSLSLS